MEGKNGRYLVLEGFADAGDFPTLFVEKLHFPPSIRRRTLEELFTFLYNSSTGKLALRSEEALGLRSPIFTAGEEALDLPTRDRGIAKYTSAKKLLLDFMEEDGDWAWTTTRRAAWDV